MVEAARENRYLFETSVFKAWFEQILRAREFDEQEAQLAAEFAVLAAMYEVETHGARKLLHLLDDEFQRSNSCQPAVQHEVLLRTAGLEVWDAKKKLGPAVAYLAQERSAQLARAQGAGIVMVNNANHYGWGGAYALHFMNDGLLCGNLCQGAIPIVTPVGGSEARLGCNAISIALETYTDECPIFLWDAGIGAVSWGEVQRRRLDGTPLPEGCVVDSHGAPTTDAGSAASLLPAGSIGNALGILIELLSAQVGAGDPRCRSVPPQSAPEGEPVTCSFVHFSLNLSSLDNLPFPHGRSRAENVAAMVDALFTGNGDARLCGLRKWQARQRYEDAGGLLFAPESIDAFRVEGERQGVPLPVDIRDVQVDVQSIHVARS